MYVAKTYWDLYNHEGVERLRCQRGVAVDIISKWNPLLSDCGPVDQLIFNVQCALRIDVILFEQDVGLVTDDWDRWTAVDHDIDSLKLGVENYDDNKLCVSKAMLLKNVL